ncbi:hypothetical protein [Cohnella sp. WQ 127256]|uniref:glucosamine inositolphosphorylceramide transferase family protein n=1 Tax=Cohnella sp. WQ 127256 TaxID=2938790 RepID=UPI002119569F|nr:hypothetical protein [Cohnella sp. WQ 127256]
MKRKTLAIIVSGLIVPKWIYDTLSNLVANPGQDVHIVVIPNHPVKGIFSCDGMIGRSIDKLPSKIKKVLGKGNRNAFKPMDIRHLTERTSRENNTRYNQIDQVLSLIGPLPELMLTNLRTHQCGIAILTVQAAYLNSPQDLNNFDYTEPGSGLALFEYESVYGVFAQDISTTIARSNSWILNNLCSVLPYVIPELLHKALSISSEHSKQKKLGGSVKPQQHPISISPSLDRNLKYAIDRFKAPPKWELMYAQRNMDLYDLSSYRRLQIPLYTEWADPFVVNHEGKSYVFYEDYPYRLSKTAHLSAAEVRSDGTLKLYEKIIVEPFHLSYPQVFRIENQYYMLPETSQDRSLRLYRCLRFPDQWTLERRLMQGKDCADSTLFYSEDRYWLFTSHSTGSEGHNSNLYLYSTTDLFADEWTSHPQNPIHTDIRRSRMAGPIYVKDGKRYRLSQYSEHYYGEAINFNEIIELNERTYREKPVSRLGPSEDHQIAGIHTYTETEEFRFVDVLRKR